MLDNTIRCTPFPFKHTNRRTERPSFLSKFGSWLVQVALAALLVFGWGFSDTLAQQTISGTITDASNGETLPGVNIVVPGTTIGTTTDMQGQYSLSVPSDADSLTFSFVGYVPLTVAISGRTTINVALSPDVTTLEDVVVVGYGTQERKQITGSVSSVKEENFVKGNVNNAAELVQSKVPGLTVSTQGSDPNSDPTIRLRGISSFGANQDPLVVIDGVIGGNLNNVDPSDISSIEVLKDASAAAIYGTRASAGVIIVTTKSGEGVAQRGESGVSVDYNGYVTLETVGNRLDVLDRAEMQALSDATGFAFPDHNQDTDFFEEISQNGSNQVHSLSLAGGADNTNYRISVNFRDRASIQKNAGFQQLNGRINLTQFALDEKLKFSFNLAATNREEDQGFGEAFRYAATFNPTSPVKPDTAGFENVGGFFEQPLFDYFNPVAIQETAFNERDESTLTGSLRADYDFSDIIPNLSFSAFYSIETNSFARREFYSQENKLRGGATVASLGPGLALRENFDGRNELFEVTTSFITDFEELGVEAIAGYSFNDFVDEGTFTEGGDFVTDAVGPNNLTFAQDFNQGEGTVSSFKSSHRIIGFFGRVSLNWDDTYFANGSIRREGSSRFGEDNKWGTFWSAGGGVEVTNLVDIPFLNRLKARGSYGVTGQDAPFSGISKQRFAPQGNFFVNGQFIQSFAPVSNPNPDLKWEEKKELNLGIDFEALDSKLTGSVEWYSQTTDDLLFQVEVPVPPNLFPTTWENIGSLETDGWEAQVDYNAITRSDLRWTTGFTFSTFETILAEFTSADVQFISNAGAPGLNDTPLVRIKEGEPIGQIWGPEFAGISSSGRWLFFDADGNQVTADQLTTADERVLGNGLPDFELGWNNTVNYRNWDLNVFVRGVFGHDMANMFRLFYETPNQITSYNVLDSAFDLVDLTESPQFSSFQVEDASFVRLQNATLGYNVPVGDNSAFSRLRLYFSVNNLFTITGYDGIDPEVNWTDPGPVDSGQRPGGGNPLAPGIERRNEWYTSRSWTLGINLEF